MATVNDRAPISLEPKGVYLVAWQLARSKKYHWGVLIALNEEGGILFHCANVNDGNETKWGFHERPFYNARMSGAFRAAMKVSYMYEDSEDELRRLRERIRDTECKVEAGDNCQSWARNAIYLMADEAFIPLQPDIDAIMSMEVEAEQFAMECEVDGTRGVQDYKHNTA